MKTPRILGSFLKEVDRFFHSYLAHTPWPVTLIEINKENEKYLILPQKIKFFLLFQRVNLSHQQLSRPPFFVLKFHKKFPFWNYTIHPIN